jgi:hypothetical protein
MTWTKIGDEYSAQSWVLSDAAYRLQTDALIWSNTKYTDGRLDKGEMYLWAKTQDPDVIAELLARHSWEDRGDHYQIILFMAWQKTSEEWLHQSAVNAVNGRKGGRPPKHKPPKPKSEPVSESLSAPVSESVSDETASSTQETEPQSEPVNDSVSEKRNGKRTESGRDRTGQDWSGMEKRPEEKKDARAQKPAPHNNNRETFAEYQARAHQDVDPADWEQAISANVRDMYDR